ncbi:exoribonuclease 2 [Mycena floridula]|nr:exoribonuclease 2 [Mycena floridula]
MGVPALFRWLSKKYPRIIYAVQEDDETTVETDTGEAVTIPVNMKDTNPNGLEFDNLYLDMNGIVHPCTHPEGKPAPETEEEMMVEIFQYTERVVNMVRPRKLLFMAIDGVAPRAKMNQQRSRRFRSAQEAQDKETAHKENLALWEGMGKEVSEEEKNKVAWDSNAITPGTPFMDLLSASLKYWVVQKMNTDPGWKNIQVLISDASVPGEGEHKIMDFIRRQRTNAGHDPNTKHVIYGLDADLIMLALATHEPYFRVLREDVFSDANSTACRICGQEGHYAAQCTATKADIKKPPPEKKPFIFLDVAILREYLEVELEISQTSFPFDLEQAIDDWVLLIFFVGNDFLPHLPSLEIREGAIDTLLKIWKQELPRMGGYLTEHGELKLARAQIILEGLAKREDEIFRRRREAEERQNQNSKRRKVEGQGNRNGSTVSGAPQPISHPLPQRPDFAAKADSIGLGAPPTLESQQHVSTATMAFSGSNHEIVANRRAIRLANLSAAEVMKAELAGGLAPVKAGNPHTVNSAPAATTTALLPSDTAMSVTDSDDIPGFGKLSTLTSQLPIKLEESGPMVVDTPVEDESEGSVTGKRKLEEVEEDGDETLPDEDEETPAVESPAIKALKVNPDGTVEQEDTVKCVQDLDTLRALIWGDDCDRLWEPGYRERYYRQKFGVEPTDVEFRKSLVKSYVEGMCWVLRYYYQGAPSWQWYYPNHFAPFAADFVDIEELDIKFELGQPFKPFEQLMGVFPAASRKHIPEPFHQLMMDEDSPIIDFYPSTFDIDMNGKRMAWQGVALLPFIDPTRLLAAMKEHYPKLTPEEVIRNSLGNDIMFASDEHPIYPFFEQLYGKRKSQQPVPIDPALSKGINGTALPNPDCLPGSTYYCPLTTQDLPDIRNDRSLSVIYFFPPQLKPHRSVMLPGVKRPARVLSGHDLEQTRNRGRGRGGWDRGGGNRGHHNDRSRNNDPFHSRPN